MDMYIFSSFISQLRIFGKICICHAYPFLCIYRIIYHSFDFNNFYTSVKGFTVLEFNDCMNLELISRCISKAKIYLFFKLKFSLIELF